MTSSTGCTKSKMISPYVQFLLDFHNVKSSIKQLHFNCRSNSLSHSYSGHISISLCNLILSWLISPWLSILVHSLQSSSYDSRVSFLTNSPDRRQFLCEWNEIAWLYKVPLISDCRVEPIIIKRKKRSSVCTWHS